MGLPSDRRGGGFRGGDDELLVLRVDELLALFCLVRPSPREGVHGEWQLQLAPQHPRLTPDFDLPIFPTRPYGQTKKPVRVRLSQLDRTVPDGELLLSAHIQWGRKINLCCDFANSAKSSLYYSI